MAGTPHYMLATVEVVLYASRDGQQRRNVIHYRYSGARPNAGELTSLLEEIRDHVIDAQEDFTALGTVWYQSTATDIEDISGLQVTLAMNRLAVGPVNNLPGAVSHCLTKRTVQRGRSKRGRFYLFDLPEDYFNGDDFNTFYVSVVNRLCNELLSARVSSRFLPAVGSRLLGGSTPMTAMSYDYVADTQVRRGKNRGI
jgi:hypothetical protein